MIVSLNWIKKYVDVNLGVSEIQDLIGARLVEVESVKDMTSIYKDVIIVKVVKATPLEGSDHLNVVLIDDAKKRSNVERDSAGLVQVVCGAPNVVEGMFAAWLPPESIVPETYGTKDEFKLAKKPLRGVVSNGMLASPKELGLYEDHSGILNIDQEVNAGDSLSQVYELDDFLFDIENKSLTHRPDAFGIIGFAREVAGIQGIAFRSPDFLKVNDKKYGTKNPEMLPKVSIDDNKLSAQYSAIVLSGADSSKKSPVEIQSYLSRIGMRPINAPVDVTNYLMMATGQPLHTFDYDKLIALSSGKPDIHVRAGRKGEKLILLDDREIEVTPDDIIISAGDTAIGLAGGMGCKNTAIDDSTKNILLESATFNLYNLRSTQMRHGIFSEAITRFTKGQPSSLCLPVLHEAVRLLGDWSGAKVVSDVVIAKGGDDTNKSINISISKINQTLGTLLDKAEIIKLLENVEFSVVSKDDNIEVLAPFWRADIHIEEDIIEEVGRLYGFDSIVPTLPLRKISPVAPVDFDIFRNKIRLILKSSGSNEVYQYSFVHGDLLKKNGQNPDNSYRITNALSPELQYYRQSLAPSLLSLIHPNTKQGYDNFAIFEFNKIHRRNDGLDEEKVPVEMDSLGFVIQANKLTGSAFYIAKSYVGYLAQQLGAEIKIVPLDDKESTPEFMPFEFKRSGKIISNDKTIGIVGEFKNSVATANKLGHKVAGFEINTRALFESLSKPGSSYRPSSKYPKTSRDICFQLSVDRNYGELINLIENHRVPSDIAITISPIDVYHVESSKTKNITINISLEPNSKTLTSDEVTSLISDITNEVVEKLQARVI
jgi:phenylalanyl-tRNA synthetase beta chain